MLSFKLSFHYFLVLISQWDNKDWGYPGFPEKGEHQQASKFMLSDRNSS